MIDSKPQKLSIILFDISGEDYQDVTPKYYNYALDNYYIQKVISAFVYNGFLVFSFTYTDEDSNFNSILAFIGYPNGTDHSINIFPYFNSLNSFNETEEKNLFVFLMNNLILDNNIFEYNIIEKINLVAIPPEIIFYNISEDEIEIGPLSNNSFFDIYHILKPNSNLINYF